MTRHSGARALAREPGMTGRGFMISNFTYHCDPVRVVFGAGAIAGLRAEAEFHKMSRLLVLCSKTRADFARRVTNAIADRLVGFCDAAGQNMPRDAFERIVADIKRLDADGFVVVGGGSPIGLAKAAAATMSRRCPRPRSTTPN